MSLQVITGPMFSGKSQELIRLLELAGHANMNVLGLKPKRDSRANKQFAARKNKGGVFKRTLLFPAFEIETPNEANSLIWSHKPDIVGIDESQFLKMDFSNFLRGTLSTYKQMKIIIAGLDMTSEGDPFGPMPPFMAMADEVVKLRAVCFHCKKWPPTATMTYFKHGLKKNPVLVGDAESYEARCYSCWLLSPE